jgi:hypothetical protein
MATNILTGLFSQANFTAKLNFVVAKLLKLV